MVFDSQIPYGITILRPDLESPFVTQISLESSSSGDVKIVLKTCKMRSSSSKQLDVMFAIMMGFFCKNTGIGLSVEMHTF